MNSLFLRLVLLLAIAVCGYAADQNFVRTRDVIYARKFGTCLTLDVFQPPNTNGYGVLFMVSGGFFSSHEAINPPYYKQLLDRGYTVFAVVHGSQPKFHIPEILQDIHRVVRFVRHNAKSYGIHPGKLGITGGSAGGHLSLTMATQGQPGNPQSRDPVERESSEIQAAACFFPPTDFLNWGAPGVDAVGVGPLAQFKPAFGPKSDTPASRQVFGKEISPLNFVTKTSAPALIIHGDRDRLVPFQQAEIYIRKCEELGVPAKLINRPDRDHGWKEMADDMSLFADWFDEHLRGIKK